MLKHERPPEKKEGTGFLSRLVKAVDGCEMEITYKGRSEEHRITVDDPYDRTSEKLHLFNADQPVEGSVQLRPKGSYKHNGVTIELIGFVTTLTDREDKVEFLHVDKKFEPVTLSMPTTLDFSFPEEKIYESYRGINAKVTYSLKVTVGRPVKNQVISEEVWISKVDHKLSQELPDTSLQRSYFRETEFGANAVSMEVGVDNVLHIEFKYDKRHFHQRERVLGLVTFKVMDLDLQYGEVGIVRKEYIGPGRQNDPVETETLQKFEIMDGTPVVGEVVPIRLYLNSIPRLTPSYPNIHNLFRVIYFVNLVLVTGEGKRYFKQQEITLYRRPGQEIPANMSVAAAA
jgi:vacuolar protein sorting-associated protein 26